MNEEGEHASVTSVTRDTEALGALSPLQKFSVFEESGTIV